MGPDGIPNSYRPFYVGAWYTCVTQLRVGQIAQGVFTPLVLSNQWRNGKGSCHFLQTTCRHDCIEKAASLPNCNGMAQVSAIICIHSCLYRGCFALGKEITDLQSKQLTYLGFSSMLNALELLRGCMHQAFFKGQWSERF